MKFYYITVTKKCSFVSTFFFPSSLRERKINDDLQQYDTNPTFSNFFFSKIFFILIFITCHQKKLERPQNHRGFLLLKNWNVKSDVGVCRSEAKLLTIFLFLTFCAEMKGDIGVHSEEKLPTIFPLSTFCAHYSAPERIAPSTSIPLHPDRSWRESADLAAWLMQYFCSKQWGRDRLSSLKRLLAWNLYRLRFLQWLLSWTAPQSTSSLLL